MPPPSHQATVSLALAAVMVAAVGALAYPLFAEDEVPAAATEAIVAPASPDKEAGPSETVSRFLAEHAPVAEPKAEAPAAAEVPVVAPAEVAVVPTVSAAPVIAAVPAKVEPAMEPPAAPQETAQQKRQREQHEAAVARQAARAAAQEKALAERAARAAAQKAAAEKAAEERAARQAADKLAAEKAAAEKAARLAAEKAAAERAAAEKLARAPAEPVAPVAKKAVAPSAGWEEVSTDKPAAPKRDMTVVVSGDRAWVQVDPKRTISVKAGDVLPGMGRVVEIRDNKVVTEKGTLTNN